MTGSSEGMDLTIRVTEVSDRADIRSIHTLAFGQSDEADLTVALLDDPSAAPVLSLLAIVEQKAIGHILFSKAHLTGAEPPFSVSILAPLAVVPDFQDRGVGGALVREGLQRSRGADTDLVFVLGHPEYYPRHGFEPAGRLGLDAPFPIADENADAWMVQALRPDLLGTVTGRVRCADTLNRPEYWRE